MELYFASRNLNKIDEIRKMMPDFIQLKGLKELNHDEEIPETSFTIAGNSHQKAEVIHSRYKVPVFADDSGLEVEELNYEPGVNSAIYAGPERSDEKNMDLLLKKLEGVENRSARFVTVITYIQPSGEIEYFRGVVNGKITISKTGTSGFGYDPIFLPDGYEQTFAQMSMNEKNAISHRGQALRKFVEYLKVNHE